MRYVIGVKIYNKLDKKDKEGMAVFDCLGGFPSKMSIEDIEESLNNNKDVKTLVYESSEKAQQMSAKLTKNYRRDDVWKKEQKWKKSKNIITFYPIKLDNNKFPFLVKETDIQTKSGDTVYLYTKKK